MIHNLNIGALSKFNLNKMPSANKRVEEIDSAIRSLEEANETTTAKFADLMPNVTSSEPVTLLNPKIMIDLIHSNARKYGLDPKLINAVIRNESGYNVNAKSPAGAVGLMQLMPETARSLGVTNINDPAQNVEAGSKYLSQLMKQYRGNIILALAAYNAGPGSVSTYNGIPPYKETQNYIYKVLKTYAGTPATT